MLFGARLLVVDTRDPETPTRTLNARATAWPDGAPLPGEPSSADMASDAHRIYSPPPNHQLDDLVAHS